MHLLLLGYKGSSEAEHKAPGKEAGTMLTQTFCPHVLSCHQLEPPTWNQFSVDDWLWVPQRHMLVSHLLLTLMWASAVRVMIPTFHGEAFKLAKSVPLSRLGSQPAVMCSSKLILTNTIGEKGRAAQARASLSLVVFDKTKFQDARTISRRVYFSGSWPVSAQRRKPERQGPNQIRGPQ